MDPQDALEYMKNLENAVKEFECGNIEESADYLDKNYLILFEEYRRVGDMLNQVREKLEESSIDVMDILALSDLSNSLSQLFTSNGNDLRRYSHLQQTGEIPTNCPTE